MTIEDIREDLKTQAEPVLRNLGEAIVRGMDAAKAASADIYPLLLELLEDRSSHREWLTSDENRKPRWRTEELCERVRAELGLQMPRPENWPAFKPWDGRSFEVAPRAK